MEVLVVILAAILAVLALFVVVLALVLVRAKGGAASDQSSGGQSLEDLLAAPTLRGRIGELILENLLAQTLPRDSYETQHVLRNGRKVDAVIRLADGLVPVDSKFPLENFRRLMEASESEHKRRFPRFRRDVRRHIDDIADRYICPGETLDFALMYIPAENVYYEIVLKADGGDDILEYAWSKRVFPTSPNSFFAFLRIIERGLRGTQMAKDTRDMIDSVTRLGDEFENFAADYETTAKHLRNAQNKHSEGLRRLDTIRSTLRNGLTQASSTGREERDG